MIIHQQMAVWVKWVLLGFSVIAAAALVSALLKGVWGTPHWLTQPSAVIAANGLLQLLLIEVLWLYHDRYYLPLLPGLIALLIGGAKRTRVTKAVMVAGVVVFAAISISGTIDNFRFNRAVSDGREWLLRRGVAPGHIDAGYALNGWWLYAHPENLLAGARPETDIPFIGNLADLPYKIAKAPMPSYEVVQVFTWHTLWAASNSIYVLRHRDLTSQWNTPSLGTVEQDN